MLLNKQERLRRNQRIAKLKRFGYSWREIAKLVGLSKEYTKTIGQSLGAIGIPANKPFLKISEDQERLFP